MNKDIYWAFIKLIISLPLVLLLAYLFIRYILGNRSINRVRPQRMRVVESLCLGPRSAIVLIEVGDRSYLIARQEGGISLLKELEELPGVLEETEMGASPADFGLFLTDQLRQFSKGGLQQAHNIKSGNKLSGLFSWISRYYKK